MERDKDIDSDKNPVTAVARKEKEAAEQDLERARDGNDLGEKFGRQNIGPTVANKQNLETKKQEDEKFERSMRKLLQQMREELERRLEVLNWLIAESNAKIEELREEIETTETLLEKQYGKDWKDRLKQGDLDADDPLLRQWLAQQQELKDYLQRREKLIQERDELEKQVAEIEDSNLPDHLKLEKMKEILERGTSPAVQEVWRNNEVSKQVQQTAEIVNNGEGQTIESLEAGITFGQIGVSFSGKAGIGKGLESTVESIRSEFAKAAEPTPPEPTPPEPTPPEKPEPVTAHNSIFKGLKMPG